MKKLLPKNDVDTVDSDAASSRKNDAGSERIKTWPTKERPRERLLAEGPERLTDADLLAIILRVGSGTFKKGVLGKNAYESALSILREFRGLRGLDRARINELLKVPGLGPAKVAQIKAAFELGKRVVAGKLTAPAFESSKAVADHFRPRFTGQRQEIVVAVFLNGQNQRLGEKEITEGRRPKPPSMFAAFWKKPSMSQPPRLSWFTITLRAIPNPRRATTTRHATS